MRLCPVSLGALLLLAMVAAGCAQGSDETDVGDRGGQKISPSSATSCVDHCGGRSEDGSCWCNAECGISGDCCDDFASACAVEVGAGGGGSSEWPGDAGAAGTATGGGAGAGGSGSGGAGGVGGAAGAGAGGSGNAGGYGSGGSSGVGGSGASGGTGGGTTAPSCVGKCGGPADGSVCWCDDVCQQNGDCCGDYASACGGSTPAGGCTPALCGTPSPGTEYGQPCYCDIGCHVYGDCCGNKLFVCGF